MPTPTATGQNIHIVALRCKSAGHATQCLTALRDYGRPDALAYECQSYEFGRKVGDDATVILIERWGDFSQLNRLLTDKVIPALPDYNALLDREFDPARDTLRIVLD